VISMDVKTLKSSVLERLAELPKELKQAEHQLLLRNHELQDARKQLTTREVELTLAGLEGKNAEERKANLLVKTEKERLAVQELERIVDAQRVEVSVLYNELKALTAMARLLASGEVAS
jgi:hypothetical protein